MKRRTPTAIFFMMLWLAITGCEQKKQIAGNEVLVEVERLQSSKTQMPQDILPYDEALAWHEYRVKRVLRGEMTAPIIRVAHWTVVEGKPVSLSASLGEKTTLHLLPFGEVKEGNRWQPVMILISQVMLRVFSI